MCVACGDSPDTVELDRDLTVLEFVEQPRAATEQHGCNVNLELVHLPGDQILARDIGPAGDPDLAVSRGRPAAASAASAPVGHESEDRVPELERFPLVMGQNEDRQPER